MLEDDVELLIAADEAERASALALALARRGTEERYSDVAADRNAERLRQLSDEVGRIAATLARLSTGPSTVPLPVEAAPATDLPPLSAETIRAVIRARRLRARYFPEELFADPAWDMLLDLLAGGNRAACACRSRACASPPPCRRRRRFAGSRRWSAGPVHPPRRSARRPPSVRRARARQRARRCAAISPKWGRSAVI